MRQLKAVAEEQTEEDTAAAEEQEPTAAAEDKADEGDELDQVGVREGGEGGRLA